jgi:D-glycero-D-manno-heptose 1,7-bisphosphate phosphatase
MAFRMVLRTRPQAVFSDRDGVIIENRDQYVRSWDDVSFIPGAIEACRGLAEAGIPLILVSNQSAVGRGLISLGDMEQIHRGVVKRIEEGGGSVAGSWICPHGPDEGCDCRKPLPGLLVRAGSELGLNLERCVMVGDAVSDMQAAEAVGVQGILVLTGRGCPQLDSVDPSRASGWVIADDFSSAVRAILDA